MNLFQRAIRSCLRKPVRSILLLLVVFLVSLLFLSGMAGRSANIAVKDSTRQAIGAGFLPVSYTHLTLPTILRV